MRQNSLHQPATHYIVEGKGAPVIFIHGVGLDAQIWEAQIKALSSKYQVICYDMLGHGKSACPPGPYTLQQFIEQLNDLFSHLNISKAHIVGFSMGGLVAQGYAMEYPEKVSSLTIVSSVAKRSPKQREAILARVEEVKNNGHKATINAAIGRWFNSSFMEQHPEIVGQIEQRLEDNDPAAYLAAYQVFATADEELYDRLTKIQCPTLVITGELDAGSTPEMAELMTQQIPRSEVVIVAGIKHMLPIEAAESLNQLLLLQLEQSSKRGMIQ